MNSSCQMHRFSVIFEQAEFRAQLRRARLKFNHITLTYFYSNAHVVKTTNMLTQIHMSVVVATWVVPQMIRFLYDELKMPSICPIRKAELQVRYC